MCVLSTTVDKYESLLLLSLQSKSGEFLASTLQKSTTDLQMTLLTQDARTGKGSV